MKRNVDKLQQELELLGLSPDQAKIYLLLVIHKELRIQKIVTLAQIPRSSVYESLKRLYELGIAEEIVEDHFKKIRPYAIGILRHDFDEKLTGLQRLAHDLQVLENVAVPVPADLQQSVRVRYYKNRSGARQLLWNTLKAQNTVYVYSEWGRSRYVGIKFYENFVADSHKRAIREKVLINPSPRALASIRQHNFPNSTISRTRIEDIRAISEGQMTIKGETFIYNDIYSQVYLQSIEINGFEIESRSFVESQRSLFETLWSMARPISSLLR